MEWGIRTLIWPIDMEARYTHPLPLTTSERYHPPRQRPFRMMQMMLIRLFCLSLLFHQLILWQMLQLEQGIGYTRSPHIRIKNIASLWINFSNLGKSLHYTSCSVCIDFNRYKLQNTLHSLVLYSAIFKGMVALRALQYTARTANNVFPIFKKPFSKAACRILIQICSF